jgi:multimeric flavodoxin WrbA
MRVVTVLGSPRLEGNTNKVLRWVEQELTAAGHEVERLNIVEQELSGCTGCNTCKLDPDSPGCIIEDDADSVFATIMDADLLVLASPLYCWGFTSQLKTLLDRCYCLMKPLPEGKKSLVGGRGVALLMTAGGPYEGNMELIEQPLAMMCKFLELVPKGKLFVPFCTKPEELGSGQQAEAQKFAAEITA